MWQRLVSLLVVEDEEDLREALCYGLRKSGYAVDSAGDGADAVDLFEINAYDLVVLDPNFPGLDGLEALRRIHAMGKAPKVLILSARSGIDGKIEGLDRGANDSLTKPFHFRELEARVWTLLRCSFVQSEAALRSGAASGWTPSQSAPASAESLWSSPCGSFRAWNT